MEKGKKQGKKGPNNQCFKVFNGQYRQNRKRLAAYKELRGLNFDDDQIPSWMKTSSPDDEEVPILEVPASKVPIEKVPSPKVAFLEVSTLGNLPQGAGTPAPGEGVPIAQEDSIAEGDQGTGSKVLSREVVPKPVDELADLPVGTDPKGAEAPPEEDLGLEQVYQQDEEVERQLRRQNIIQLADGNYVQARPDGVGGVELVPVEASQLDRMKTDTGSAISLITAKSLEVQMDVLVKKVGFNPSTFQSYEWCMAKTDPASGRASERY